MEIYNKPAKLDQLHLNSGAEKFADFYTAIHTTHTHIHTVKVFPFALCSVAVVVIVLVRAARYVRDCVCT